MTKIICVGSMNTDIAAYGATLPRPGETVMGHAIATSPGGKGLNQAVAARRLGGDVAMVGMLGRDDNGDRLAHFLAAEGVDITGVQRLDRAATGAAVILVADSAQNAIVVIPGANMAWTAADLPAAFAPRAGDIVVAQFEIPDAVIAAAFTRARAAGARTILNAAPARALPSALLPLIDILAVNETELGAACGTALDEADHARIEQAALALAARCPAIVVTLGSRGAIVAHDGRIERIAAMPVAAVDTAGAGDCFIGAFAAALARGEALAAAAAYANRAAAVSVTRKGTAVAMPRASDL